MSDDNVSIFTDPTGELPNALTKACSDPFDYVIGLRDGNIIRFEAAEVQQNRKWVKLTGITEVKMPEGWDCQFPRGIDVRISDIVWVADAPAGS